MSDLTVPSVNFDAWEDYYPSTVNRNESFSFNDYAKLLDDVKTQNENYQNNQDSGIDKEIKKLSEDNANKTEIINDLYKKQESLVKQINEWKKHINGLNKKLDEYKTILTIKDQKIAELNAKITKRDQPREKNNPPDWGVDGFLSEFH